MKFLQGMVAGACVGGALWAIFALTSGWATAFWLALVALVAVVVGCLVAMAAMAEAMFLR